MSVVSMDTRFYRAISFARRKHRQVDRVFNRVSRCDRDAFAACWSEPELQVVMQQLCSGIICLDQVLSKQECESVIAGSRNRLSESSMLASSSPKWCTALSRSSQVKNGWSPAGSGSTNTATCRQPDQSRGVFSGWQALSQDLVIPSSETGTMATGKPVPDDARLIRKVKYRLPVRW